MEEESPDELLSVKSRLLATALVGVVLPAKRYLAVFHADEPLVGDGHTVGIPCKVLEDLLGPAEGGLRVDNPVTSLEGLERRLPSSWVSKVAEFPFKSEFSLLKSLP